MFCVIKYIVNLFVFVVSISCMLCMQGSAENQIFTARTPCLNITITITITITTTAVLNHCYRKETAYTTPAYPYWVSFHDAHGDLCHTH